MAEALYIAPDLCHLLPRPGMILDAVPKVEVGRTDEDTRLLVSCQLKKLLIRHHTPLLGTLQRALILHDPLDRWRPLPQGTGHHRNDVWGKLFGYDRYLVSFLT